MFWRTRALGCLRVFVGSVPGVSLVVGRIRRSDRTSAGVCRVGLDRNAARKRKGSALVKRSGAASTLCGGRAGMQGKAGGQSRSVTQRCRRTAPKITRADGAGSGGRGRGTKVRTGWQSAVRCLLFARRLGVESWAERWLKALLMVELVGAWPRVWQSRRAGHEWWCRCKRSCLEMERDERDWEKLKRREWSSLFRRLLWCRQPAAHPVGCRRRGADALECTPWSLLNRRSRLALAARVGGAGIATRRRHGWRCQRRRQQQTRASRRELHLSLLFETGQQRHALLRTNRLFSGQGKIGLA